MFEEDCEWSCGKRDPLEEDLHRRLFGEPDTETVDTSGGVSEAKKPNAKKRKREGDKAVKEGRSHAGKRGRRGKSKDRNVTVRDNGESVAPQDSMPPEKRKKIKKLQENGQDDQQSVHKDSPPQQGLRERSAKGSKLFSKMSSQLEGSRFRMINQQLYTSTGADAKQLFDRDPDLFGVYHRGFAAQVAKWPENPIDRVIAHVRSLPEGAVVCDFGCGGARLAQSVNQRVHSFDLVAINERVTACDMAHVPLKRHTGDVCVFCLSLMGTNVSDFIREARRVARKEGELRIYEVSSRFASFERFSRDVEAFGFKLVSAEEFSKMFVEFVFTAVKKSGGDTDLPQISLKPCVYKRR